MGLPNNVPKNTPYMRSRTEETQPTCTKNFSRCTAQSEFDLERERRNTCALGSALTFVAAFEIHALFDLLIVEMEAKLAQSLQISTWNDSEKITRKPNGSLHFSPRSREPKGFRILISNHLQPTGTATWHKPEALRVSCSYRNYPGSVLQSGSFPASFDEAMILKNKAEDIEPFLNGRCIYLVGMMGSGKTTVGRILSDVLSYSFFDSDTLIEQAVGATSVAEIFKLYGEGLFRDNETEVLRKLSKMQQLVVSTGGGAVIRPINWKYMQKGISVWLDVPLEALARRIASVGTESRPLLHQEEGDAYAKAFTRLSSLMEERSEAYANASARVSLENIAAKLGYIDVCNLTPTVIAIEALEQIENFLKN
ncbi:hypothetical protein RHGRI_029864 [Rhododendron griersonianum]|uniref:shikimate kinase n=1 Tax=Rhododendron griersonianum TaxID=479676 RepID=A0AAV6IRB9_9ERIC|nr:hypothetical protein RHGRI_029864 [Rhododendron griersonianum]